MMYHHWRSGIPHKNRVIGSTGGFVQKFRKKFPKIHSKTELRTRRDLLFPNLINFAISRVRIIRNFETGPLVLSSDTESGYGFDHF